MISIILIIIQFSIKLIFRGDLIMMLKNWKKLFICYNIVRIYDYVSNINSFEPQGIKGVSKLALQQYSVLCQCTFGRRGWRKMVLVSQSNTRFPLETDY